MSIEIIIRFLCLEFTPFRFFLGMKEREIIRRNGFELFGYTIGNRWKYLFGYFLYQWDKPNEYNYHHLSREKISKYHLTIYFLFQEYDFHIGNYGNDKLDVQYIKKQNEYDEDYLPF